MGSCARNENRVKAGDPPVSSSRSFFTATAMTPAREPREQIGQYTAEE